MCACYLLPNRRRSLFSPPNLSLLFIVLSYIVERYDVDCTNYPGTSVRHPCIRMNPKLLRHVPEMGISLDVFVARQAREGDYRCQWLARNGIASDLRLGHVCHVRPQVFNRTVGRVRLRKHGIQAVCYSFLESAQRCSIHESHQAARVDDRGPIRSRMIRFVNSKPPLGPCA